MSWSNFDDLKKFARKKTTPKTKRPTGWQNKLSGKRRRTADNNVSFVFSGEDGEIEGFSSDDDGEGDKLMVHQLETRNLNQPVVKRKYKKRHLLREKRSSAATKDNVTVSENVQEGKQFHYGSVSKESVEDEIIWAVSDHEDNEDSDNDNIGCFHTERHLSLCTTLTESPKGKFSTGDLEATTKSQHFESTGEAIGDFHSDEERSSSQESLSATISNPSPTPASPAVVGAPKTASEWLKQVQHETPIHGDESLYPEKRATVMQCDSAKKKKKFMRAGLAEQLHRIIAREKSAQTFWHHRPVDTGKEQHNAPGSSLWNTGCLLVQILSDLPQSSLHLTQCLLSEGNDSHVDPHQRLVNVLFRCETWKDMALHVGAVVKIHPPWQKLAVPGSPHPIVLCTYFCERQETLSELSVQDIASVKAEGVIIPKPNGYPLRFERPSQKGFKPSKLLFKDPEDGGIKPAKLASLSLTPVEPTVSKDTTSQPNRSILNAIDSCGGYGGAAASFIAVVQRVYCKRIQSSRQSQVISGIEAFGLKAELNVFLVFDFHTLGKEIARCPLLNKTLKSNAAILNEAEEVRWVFLVQDIQGMFAEIQVPTTFQDSANWYSIIATGEGKTLAFTDVRVLHRTNRTRSPALFDIIHSLWCASAVMEASSDNGGSQIDTQESDVVGANASCPPDFSYVLTVQGSSGVSIYQHSEDCRTNLLYKRTISRSLRNLQLLSINKTTRFTTCCKLLYCRDSDTSRSPPNSHIPPIFELFVVDSSLQTAGTFTGDSQTSPYVRIIAHSSYVMSSQLKDVLNCPGAILSLTDLLCSVEGQEKIVVDAYSVIRKGIPDSISISCRSPYEVPIPTEMFDHLACLQPAPLPALTVQSRLGHMYLIEGCVTGVDEESACCWLVCGACGDPKITPKQGTRSDFFCLSCNDDVVAPQTRTHLEVLVRVQSFPNAHVTVKLLQNTINKLLPVSYEDSEQQYDIEAVLGKKLGPMNCYVIERARKDDGTLITSAFTLEEIEVFS